MVCKNAKIVKQTDLLDKDLRVHRFRKICEESSLKKYVCSLSPLCLNLITQSVMIRHAEILNAFKSRFDIDPPPEVDQDLTYLKMILIKACDVSNEIRPPAVAEPWVERLLQEYFVQVCITLLGTKMFTDLC